MRHQRVAHSAMETRGVVVHKRGANELTVYMGSQSPRRARAICAKILRLPESSIRVISKDVGGSFGLKSRPWREEIAVIAAGLLLGRPIKWIEDRLENFTAANQAREQQCTIRSPSTARAGCWPRKSSACSTTAPIRTSPMPTPRR